MSPNQLSASALPLALVLGYLFGSVPFGLVLTRFAGGPDIRTIGSGNIGATNVLRTGRKGLAAATLLLDMLKGTAAVLLAGALWHDQTAQLAAAFGAFIGHVAPLWLQFKGGKGVATYLGCLLGVFWPVALIFAGLWLSSAALSRYSSLAALVATALSPMALTLWGQPAAGALFAVLTLILWWKHRENIRRLLAGSEGRIGQKA